MIRVEIQYAYPVTHPRYGDTIARSGLVADCRRVPTVEEAVAFIGDELGRHNVTITSIKPVTCENGEAAS